MQAAWTRFRDAQLYAFHAAVPVLEFARAKPQDFRVYCQDRSVKGDLLETQVAELLIQDDPDADAISRERRAEYGAAIGWFADRNLCPEADADKAVHLAKRNGRIAGIAGAYRNHKNAENPRAAAAKERTQAAKATNDSQRNLSKIAAEKSGDSKFQATGSPRHNDRAERDESVLYARDRAYCTSKGGENSTKQGDLENSVNGLTSLAVEFGRILDEAGVVPSSPADLPYDGVGLYLAIYDRPRQPSMYVITYPASSYRSFLDKILQQQREAQSRKSRQFA
jgi:hypothetical protein